MLTEGSVTGYLDSQVLIAAWQAVLQMLPQDREYNQSSNGQTDRRGGVHPFLANLFLDTLLMT